jgi:phosphoserine phosphatase RsbU/P
LFGLTAVSISVMRRGTSAWILIWLGIWSGTYGVRILISSSAVIANLPHIVQLSIPFIDVTISYLVLVFALLAWLDLTRGFLRRYMQTMLFVGLVFALAGISWFVISGNDETFMLYNNLITAVSLIILLSVVTVRKLSEKFLVLPNRRVLAVGICLFAAEALYSNLSRFLGYQTLPFLGWLGFAALLFSLAYVAGQMIFSSERRLFAIENELETARHIQSSILPDRVPEIDNLSIVANYQPMAAVAGDFYEFICIDSKHAGFLVTDVSGHGVPAALIASMIKIAVQSVVDSAHDPAKVMQLLNKILGNQLQGQFVTASYLYIDLTTGQASYSAAGHPPLLYWDSSAKKLNLIESNGLPIGVMKEIEYPSLKISFNSGDRYILYTDGLIEAEDLNHAAFGDRRLSEVIQSQANSSVEKISSAIQEELKKWQQKSDSQQDDITWIILGIK